MENRKVLIVGGGIAGLCTGVYLRRLGFDTEILEMHTISGGLATAWREGSFTFENCIHWLVGSKDGGQLNASWKEVFDIGRLEFFEDPVFQVLERGADRITIYRDPDRLEAELLAKAPEDAAAGRRSTFAYWKKAVAPRQSRSTLTLTHAPRSAASKMSGT